MTGALGFVAGVHDFENMEGVLGGDQARVAGEEALGNIGSPTDPIVLARIFAKGFENGLALAGDIDPGGAPIPALHVHGTLGGGDVDGVKLASFAGEAFAIEIDEAGLHMGKDAVAVVHDEHRVFVRLDLDDTLVLNLASRVDNGGHADDFLDGAEQAREGSDVVNT